MAARPARRPCPRSRTRRPRREAGLARSRLVRSPRSARRRRCGGGPILANPPLDYPSPPPPTARPIGPADPIPVVLPRDDGPHDRLTEWWYYTGHLEADGRAPVRVRGGRLPRRARLGAGRRGPSHLALTDESGDRFTYAQRSEIGAAGRSIAARRRRAADRLRPAGRRASTPSSSPAGAPAFGGPWRLAGSDGVDSIEAALTPEEAAAAGRAFGLELALEPTKPPALHDGDGFVDFGPAGSSYYYSRTRLAATGELSSTASRLAVDGHRLVRPPVGRLHLGRRRLGLVRDQPRRRHGHHALGRPRRSRRAGPRLRNAGRTATGRPATSPATRSMSVRPAPGRARSPAASTRPTGASRSRTRTWSSTSSRPSPTRSSTRARPRASSTGRARRSCARRAVPVEPLGGEAYVEVTRYGE